MGEEQLIHVNSLRRKWNTQYPSTSHLPALLSSLTRFLPVLLTVARLILRACKFLSQVVEAKPIEIANEGSSNPHWVSQTEGLASITWDKISQEEISSLSMWILL